MPTKLLWLLCLALAACGSTAGAIDASIDASISDDAGLKPDAGQPVDAGEADSGQAPDAGSGLDAGVRAPIQSVFVIVMTSHSWSTLTGAQASSAPYINQLVVSAAHAEQYFTPPNNHPSEPNFIWLEAGDNLGITDSNSPSANHKATTEHLSTQLEAAGISWRAYAEGISGTSCPLTASGSYNPKHLPQVYFDDVTDGTIGTSAHCISHVRPYTELAADLSADRAARYTFITPDLCNDMSGIAFGSTCASNLIKAGDDWLHTAVPVITASAAFKRGGVLFIVWDEGEPTVGAGADGPIGLIAIGASVKPGFASQVHFTHSSLLRTIEEIFGVTPLRGAATSNDLSALFTSFP